MPRPVAQSHDGVTVVVPVDDEVAAAEDTDQPRHRDPRQPRRILGGRRKPSFTCSEHTWSPPPPHLHQDVGLQLHPQQHQQQLH